MFKKLRIILVLISLSLTLCIMSNTFSRYVAQTNGDVEASLAKWKILLNEEDITSSTSKDINIKPTIYEQKNTKKDVVAPSSSGYFDIAIDPSNVDLSFNYTIALDIDNKQMIDLMITKYAILPNGITDDKLIEKSNLTNNKITKEMLFDNKTNNFKFDSFTVRVYFEWYEGTGENMDDTSDTAVAYNETDQNNTFKISANIAFEQVI